MDKSEIPKLGDTCYCIRCETRFEAYIDIGDVESDYCPLCNSDNAAHMCWERDTFGD